MSSTLVEVHWDNKNLSLWIMGFHLPKGAQGAELLADTPCKGELELAKGMFITLVRV